MLRYSRLFLAEEQPEVILSLLSGEAYHRVSEAIMFRDENIHKDFKTIRHSRTSNGKPGIPSTAAKIGQERFRHLRASGETVSPWRLPRGRKQIN